MFQTFKQKRKKTARGPNVSIRGRSEPPECAFYHEIVDIARKVHCKKILVERRQFSLGKIQFEAVLLGQLDFARIITAWDLLKTLMPVI